MTAKRLTDENEDEDENENADEKARERHAARVF